MLPRCVCGNSVGLSAGEMSENPPEGGAIADDPAATRGRGVEGSKGTVGILARLVRLLEEEDVEVEVAGVEEAECVEGAGATFLLVFDLDPPDDDEMLLLLLLLLPLMIGEAVGVASDPEPEPMFIREAGVTGAKVDEEFEVEDGATGRGVNVGAMTMPPGELGAIVVVFGARSAGEEEDPEGAMTASHEILA